MIQRVMKRIGKEKFNEYKQEIKQRVSEEKSKNAVIRFDKLEEVMDKYGVSLGEEDRNTFREAFGVSNTGDLAINVDKLVNYEKT